MKIEDVVYELNKLIRIYKSQLELNLQDEKDFISMGKENDVYLHMLHGQNCMLEFAIASTSIIMDVLTKEAKRKMSEKAIVRNQKKKTSPPKNRNPLIPF
jgi:hypothetical protein